MKPLFCWVGLFHRWAVIVQIRHMCFDLAFRNIILCFNESWDSSVLLILILYFHSRQEAELRRGTCLVTRSWEHCVLREGRRQRLKGEVVTEARHPGLGTLCTAAVLLRSTSCLLPKLLHWTQWPGLSLSHGRKSSAVGMSPASELPELKVQDLHPQCTILPFLDTTLRALSEYSYTD